MPAMSPIAGLAVKQVPAVSVKWRKWLAGRAPQGLSLCADLPCGLTRLIYRNWGQGSRVRRDGWFVPRSPYHFSGNDRMAMKPLALYVGAAVATAVVLVGVSYNRWPQWQGPASLSGPQEVKIEPAPQQPAAPP